MMGRVVRDAPYIGPGDIWPHVIWGGLRAYSKAKCGDPCCRVVRASDSATLVINSLANGSLDASAVTAFIAGTTGKVDILYDQVAGNDLINTTDASRPSITASTLNASYGLIFTAASSGVLESTSTMGTVAQPFTFTGIMRQAAATLGYIINIDGGYGGAGVLRRSGPVFDMYAGAELTAGYTAAAWYSCLFMFNGASSTLSINYSETTGNAGTQATSDVPFRTSDVTEGTFADVDYTELGWVNNSIPLASRMALHDNMHISYGGW